MKKLIDLVNDPDYLHQEREESRKIAEKLNTVPPTSYMTAGRPLRGGTYGSTTSLGGGRSYASPDYRSSSYGAGSYRDTSVGGTPRGSFSGGFGAFPSQTESEELINQFSRVTGCGYFEVELLTFFS